MRALDLPQIEIQKSAKQFLITLVPELLKACGVKPQQSFYGFHINIEAEAAKRINAMTEETAKCALESLKRLLNQWEK